MLQSDDLESTPHDEANSNNDNQHEMQLSTNPETQDRSHAVIQITSPQDYSSALMQNIGNQGFHPSNPPIIIQRIKNQVVHFDNRKTENIVEANTYNMANCNKIQLGGEAEDEQAISVATVNQQTSREPTSSLTAPQPSSSQRSQEQSASSGRSPHQQDLPKPLKKNPNKRSFMKNISLHKKEKAIQKVKRMTQELYDSKAEIDISNFHNPPKELPEVNPTIHSVNFYEGKSPIKEEKYNPLAQYSSEFSSDKNISFSDMVSSCKMQSFISIVGYPGAGKTTLSKRLARKLSSESRDFVVFWMRFINMSNSEDEILTLDDFLLGDPNFNLSDKDKYAAFEWIQNHPDKCFIVLDGFDQVSWSLEEKPKRVPYGTRLTYQEIVTNLCQGEFLRGCHLVFTSRPHTMMNIPPPCRPRKTYFLGDLSPGDMRKLFYAFVNDKSRADSLWNAFKTTAPHLESMCHNPLMLNLFVRASLHSSKDVKDIVTMTRVFRTVMENFKACGHAASVREETVVKLSRIAYKATKMGTVLITPSDLEKESLKSDSIQGIVVTLVGSNKDFELLEGVQRLYFTHQTFQEYFAAWYICCHMGMEEFTDFLQHHLLTDHWSVVEQFVSGILLDPETRNDRNSEKEKWFHTILCEQTKKVARSSGKESRIRTMSVCKILRESNDSQIATEVTKCFSGSHVSMQSITLTQSNVHALAVFLGAFPGRLGRLGLNNCKMDSNQFLLLKDALKRMPGTIVELDVSDNSLKCIDEVTPILKKVEGTLFLRGCLHGDKSKTRSVNSKERKVLQKMLNQLGDTKLKIDIDGWTSLERKI